MSRYILKKLLIISLIFGVSVGGFYPLYQKDIDINEDGIIDVCDVQQLVSAIISNNVSNLPDINNDGKIDIQDLQILMKNMGTKQKTTKIQVEVLNGIIRANYDIKKITKIETHNIIKIKKNNLIRENSKFLAYSKRCIQGKAGRENNSSTKLCGEKYLAYHISAKSPPKI